MDKKLLMVVGALVILVVGAYGAYRVYKHFARLSATPSVQTATGTGQPSAMSSLKDLISKGIAQSCTYTSDKSQGTIYMSGGKVRADINTTVGSVATKAHMIMMDNTTYIWTDEMSTGFKMAYDPNATPVPGASPSTLQGAIDANTSMNYKCSAWVADGSKFALPAGVTFTSFGTPSTTGASSQCSYCDSLSGTDKTQCLTALKCN
jgi:hypothetical protein